MLPACLAAVVLLLDASGSISDHQFAIQRDGTAAAFEDSRVIAAIRASPGVAVLAGVFGYEAHRRIGWRMIRDEDEGRDFAATLRALPRDYQSSVTAIGAAVDFARRELEAPPCDPRVSVIDISTDGAESLTRLPPATARDQAAADGIIINALLFVDTGMLPPDDDPALSLAAAEAWMRENIVTGFVRIANGGDGYAEAFREKFLREIAAPRGTRVEATLH